MAEAMSKVPEEEGLAKLWEADLRVRERMRFNDGKLLVWPKNKLGKEMVGTPSMQALAMNSHIMCMTAAWWCPTQKTPKTPSIQAVKAEAWKSLPNWLSFSLCFFYQFFHVICTLVGLI